MFQKHFSIEAENKVSGKDRKKLRTALQRVCPRLVEEDIETLLPLKTGDCTVARIKAPHRGHIYLLDGAPLVLELPKSEGLIPCLPCLWRLPQLLPVIRVKHSAVSKFILGGADLMLPGVQLPFEEGFLRGTLVSICIPGNPFPFAMGRAAMTSAEAQRESTGKGRLVEVLQSYGDLMMGHFSDVPPPNEGFASALITPVAEPEATPPPESLSGDKTESEEEDVSAGPAEADVADMDAILQQCFLQALRKGVKDTDLPLPAGELWIKHMLPHKQPGINVDVHRSSFKKMSKFLQSFAAGEHPLLTLKVEKYSHETVIISIDREHDILTTFRPYADERQEVAEEGTSTGLQIEEVYRMGRELNQVLIAIGLEPGCVLSKREAVEVPFRYVKHADLDQGVPDREHVLLDRVLGEALFKGLLRKSEKIPEYWPKKELREAVMKRMHVQYRISRGSEELLKKGGPPVIQIRTARRSGNKFETRVSGLEMFLVDVIALAASVQKAFACSTSLQDAFHKGTKEQELVIQGKQDKRIAELLREDYGIHDKWIQL